MKLVIDFVHYCCHSLYLAPVFAIFSYNIFYELYKYKIAKLSKNIWIWICQCSVWLSIVNSISLVERRGWLCQNGWSAKYSAWNENHMVSARPINFRHTRVYWIYWKSTLGIFFYNIQSGGHFLKTNSKQNPRPLKTTEGAKSPKYLVVGNYGWFLVHWPFSPDVRNWSLASLTMTINFETRALLTLQTTKSYSKKSYCQWYTFPIPIPLSLEQHKNCRPVFLRTFLRTFHHGFLFGRLSCSVSKPTQEANFFPAQLDLPSGKSEWIDIETSEGNLFFMGKGSQTIAFRADLSRMVSSLIENIWNMESARLMQSNFNIWLKLIKYLWTMVNSWNAWIESYGRKSRYVFGCTDEIAGYTDIEINTCISMWIPRKRQHSHRVLVSMSGK